MLRTNETGFRSGVVSRIAAALSAVGVTFAVLLGSAFPAAAEGASVANQAAQQSDGTTQAIIVGALAFVLMIGAAGAVLWFTVRDRNHERV